MKGGSLMIKRVSHDDQGVYRCRHNNRVPFKSDNSDVDNDTDAADDEVEGGKSLLINVVVRGE